MPLSHGDEIAVTMLRRRIKRPKRAVVCQPFAASQPLSLCCSVFAALIFPVSASLCAQASNELVWFPRPATGIFLLPSASRAPLPAQMPHVLAVFTSRSSISPKDFPGCGFFFSRFLHSYSRGAAESNALHFHGPPACNELNARPMWSCQGVKNAQALVLLAPG